MKRNNNDESSKRHKSPAVDTAGQPLAKASGYRTPLRVAVTEFTEKKSRFICHITPVSSEEDALHFLNSIRVKHRGANHNVYAYRVKNNNICRYSDDGEPSGTAGLPLVDSFLKQDVYDFCSVATRYFGGIHLGAGGLVRAYSRCGSAALEASGVGIMREISLCSTTMSYSVYEIVKRLLVAGGVDIGSEDFGAEVMLKFSLPSEDLPELQKDLTELTAGAVSIIIESVKMGIFQEKGR